MLSQYLLALHYITNRIIIFIWTRCSGFKIFSFGHPHSAWVRIMPCVDCLSNFRATLLFTTGLNVALTHQPCSSNCITTHILGDNDPLCPIVTDQRWVSQALTPSPKSLIVFILHHSIFFVPNSPESKRSGSSRDLWVFNEPNSSCYDVNPEERTTLSIVWPRLFATQGFE